MAVSRRCACTQVSLARGARLVSRLLAAPGLGTPAMSARAQQPRRLDAADASQQQPSSSLPGGVGAALAAGLAVWPAAAASADVDDEFGIDAAGAAADAAQQGGTDLVVSIMFGSVIALLTVVTLGVRVPTRRGGRNMEGTCLRMERDAIILGLGRMPLSPNPRRSTCPASFCARWPTCRSAPSLTAGRRRWTSRMWDAWQA